MRRVPLFLALLGLLVFLPGLRAADGTKKAPAKSSDAAFRFPKQIQPTDEQKAKLGELEKEYGSQLEAIDARIAAVMTPERQKTAAEARKKAAAEGKKGKEVREAVATALNLPEEDKAKLKEAMADRGKLMKEINAKKMGLLTDEQKAQLKSKPKKK
ncbi:MAG TPA: hypothetical protein VJ739_12070 [Gemmataceae bacterium]|nr:hypothetical protein [Gemmataceae bacterium]